MIEKEMEGHDLSDLEEKEEGEVADLSGIMEIRGMCKV